MKKDTPNYPPKNDVNEYLISNSKGFQCFKSHSWDTRIMNVLIEEISSLKKEDYLEEKVG